MFKGAVCSGHHLTTEVAKTILQEGGNAFDAAAAAYFASIVSEPMMASAGAGGFANIFLSNGQQFVLDFFCQTPKKKNLSSPFKEIKIDFGESQESFFIGASSMAVPGAMAFVDHLVKFYGRMSLKDIIQPARQMAKEGIKYTPFQAADTALLGAILQQSQKGRSLFFENDMPLTTGSLFCMHNYADFLEEFAREKSRWFYEGEIAQKISSYSEDNGGSITMIDFQSYEILKRPVHKFKLDSLEWSTVGFPSLGGKLLELFLQSLFTKRIEAGSVFHYEHLRKAFEKCLPFLEQPLSIVQQLDESVVEKYSHRIPGGTSHFNIVDKEGNAIALSTSIGEGSSYFIPGTDMQMNNMLGEMGLLPKGLNSWKENQRLNSMMCPTLGVDQKGNPTFLIGSGGSSRIPFSIGQTIYNRFYLNQSLQTAVHSPRMFESASKIYLEHGIETDQKETKDLRIWQEFNMLFGGTHCIDLHSLEAIGDDRREGSGIIL